MKGMRQKKIRLIVNGNAHELEVGDKPHQINPSHTLAHTIRETLGLTGTKISCDEGACGACTVIMEGKAVLSCMLLTVECHGKTLLTIEGLRNPETGELDPIQKSFIEHTAFQCGFCTPGMIMSTKALLLKHPHPTEEQIQQGLSGNFCRCISHYHVLEAIRALTVQKGNS